MVKISLLVTSVATLFCYIAAGFALRKTKLAEESFAKNVSVLVIYVGQTAMLLHGFLIAFDKQVFKNFCLAFLFVFLIHVMLYILVRQLLKKTPQKVRSCLRYGIMFSNAGFMGIPVITDVFGESFLIYATAYAACFNIFSFSLGRLLYTEDKKYISVKKLFINPGFIPVAIGVILYVTGAGGWIQAQLGQPGIVSVATEILYKACTVFKDLVAPASMIVIGVRLADVQLKGVFKDAKMYAFLAIRMFLCPVLVFLLLKPFHLMGVLNDAVLATLFVLSSTPAASATTMFAEMYNADSVYAGKLVALTTLSSIVTMPLVALLLSI